MKRITFMDGPLNGQVKWLDPAISEHTCSVAKTMLPPCFEIVTYRELVPGYWRVVKTELKEMGI